MAETVQEALEQADGHAARINEVHVFVFAGEEPDEDEDEE